MSNALAIAGVTATLKDLLDDGIANGNLDGLGPIEVTARPVDKVIGEDEKNRINIYPWKVTPNLGFMNECLPSHNSAGTRVSGPRLALDLHYMITATGIADLNGEILLGYAMQQLHEHPVLTQADIRAALNANPPPVGGAILPAAYRALVASSLADQVERLRISPQNPKDEDLTKIWPAFNVALRMTAFYRISVVLLEADRTIEPGPPVRDFAVDTMPLRRPQITRIVAQSGDASSPEIPGAPIVAGGRISLRGSGLVSDQMELHLGSAKLALNATVGTGLTGLSVVVPAELRAGLHLAMIEHMKARPGNPPLVLESSNGYAILVAPSVENVTITGNENVTQINGIDEIVLNGDATFRISNAITSDQSARLHLQPVDVSKPRRAFKRVKNDADSDNLVFVLADLIKGDYLWQLEVDGGETAGVTQTFEAP